MIEPEFLKNHDVNILQEETVYNDQKISLLKKGNGELKIFSLSLIHGNEPAPFYAIKELLLEKFPDNISYYFIPISNPYGFFLYLENEKRKLHRVSEDIKEERKNKNGVDLNRDFLFLTQKETKFIRDSLYKVSPHIVIDHHEFYWKDGFPPKIPHIDDDGFFITITDSPYEGVAESVRNLSEKLMQFLYDEFSKHYPLKLRHFIPKEDESYNILRFFGGFSALNLYPKILFETWGVGAYNTLFKERVSSHKKAILKTFEFVKLYKDELKVLEKMREKMEKKSFEKSDFFLKVLNSHSIDYKIKNNLVEVYANSGVINFLSFVKSNEKELSYEKN